jgi:hypothetical protein
LKNVSAGVGAEIGLAEGKGLERRGIELTREDFVGKRYETAGQGYMLSENIFLTFIFVVDDISVFMA